MFLKDHDEFNLLYDLEKIPNYNLPDPLITKNGNKIKNEEEWKNIQRNELINLLADNLYGHIPGKFENLKVITKSIDENFFNSLAIKKEIRIQFNDKVFIDLLIFLPNNVSEAVPIFLGMNFFGNHSISKDNITPVSERMILESDINYQKKK